MTDPTYNIAYPTEPGVYEAARLPAHRKHLNLVIREYGEWEEFDFSGGQDADPIKAAHPYALAFGPFRYLESLDGVRPDGSTWMDGSKEER
jgi:hypothetical protein